MLVEEYEHEGIEVKIYQEEDMLMCDPRDCDNLGTMYVYRPGYELGDVQLDEGPPEGECPKCDGEGGTEDEDCERCFGTGYCELTMVEWLRTLNAVAAMPLFIYEHGLATMDSGRFIWLADDEPNESDTRSSGRFMGDDAGWDTSFSGVIIATPDKLNEHGIAPNKREDIERILEGEVREYGRWMEGDVYCYVVAEDTPFMDSCGCLIGIEYAREEANFAAKHAAKEVKREIAERADMAARDIHTIGGH